MTVSTELVNRYIESAEPFVESKTDRLILQRAEESNTPLKYRRRRNPHEPATSKEGKIVESLQDCVWEEINEALCKKTGRYRKNVETMRDNVNILIGMIALYLAGKLGIAVAVIAALVAATLRLALQMGVTVFCKRFKSGFF